MFLGLSWHSQVLLPVGFYVSCLWTASFAYKLQQVVQKTEFKLSGNIHQQGEMDKHSSVLPYQEELQL